MLAKERQNEIDALLQKNGAVTTGDLMTRFDVSLETVRRDLMVMEQQGRLARVHGGAVVHGEMKTYAELRVRNLEYSDEKLMLGRAAAQLVQEGDIIAIDAGSTALGFAEALKARLSRLTVITHSLDVFECLCNYRDFSVILCAGHYMRAENAFYGALTLGVLRELHAPKLFLCPAAVSLRGGICDFNLELFQIQQQMLKIADEVYVLADSSKFEKNALLKLDDMKSNYCYVTDNGLPPELRKLYAENGLRVITDA